MQTATHFEIVINNKFGGFNLSAEGSFYYTKLSKCAFTTSISRDDKDLIQTVRDLGDKANSSVSRLKIVFIPIEFKNFYTIEEYDGIESVSIEFADYFTKTFQSLNIEELPKAEIKNILRNFERVVRLREKFYKNM